MLLIKNKPLLIFASVVMLLLVGCGGGSSSDTSSTNSTEQESAQDQTEQDSPASEEQTATVPDKSTPSNQIPTNQQPSANITGAQQVTSGETVFLDGSSSSDPDGDSLNYSWSQIQGTSVSLADTANPTLSFIAPNVDQVSIYRFQLQVDDGQLSDTATISITLSPMVDSTAPSIVATTPQQGAMDVSITTTITVDFDEPLQDTLINDQSLVLSVDLNQLSGRVSYDAQNNRLTLTPENVLSAATIYTVTLGSNLEDLAGNPVIRTSWRFTTGSEYNLGQTPQTTIDQCMSTSDKVMLTLINNARAQSRSCGATDYPAAASISWHCNLELAAQGHSSSMAEHDFFSHTGLDDSSPGDRITAAGYFWRTYGENIAAGYLDEESVMIAWLESPGHCANIMNPYFTEVGVAIDENPLSEYRIYWTQDFADSF
jgi:uncharacterized protein YkwD/outer membrane murein-binding lipoprotein Lpp